MGAGTRKRLTGACDALIAVAAIVIITAAHLPWFQATLTPSDPDDTVQAPNGAATGLYAHGSLWVAIGIAVLQLALLLTRYYPGSRLRVPPTGLLLALGSGLVCLLVTADFLIIPRPWADILYPTFGIPSPWEGTPYRLVDGPTLVMTRSYVPVVAIAAAVTSLIAAIVSPGPPAMPAGENPDGYFPPAAGDDSQEFAAD